MRHWVVDGRAWQAAVLAGMVVITATGCFGKGARGDFALPADQRPLEIPPALVRDVRPKVSASRPSYGPPRSAALVDTGGGPSLRLGQRVMHPSFGEGVVMDAEGSGAHARIQVNFENGGAKWLVLGYANLQPL